MFSPSCLLIVNADDLGIADVVNHSILKGMCQGMITSASLMVCMPSAGHAMSEWKANVARFRYGAGLGIHFCLTSGPSAIPESVPLLVDSNGMLRLGFAGLVKHLYSLHRNEFLTQVAAELDAQLAKADEFAKRFHVEFDHIDSHQHVHVLPGIGPLIEARARQRKLILRVPCERYGSWRRWGRSVRLRFPAGVAKKMILDHYASRSLRDKPSVGYFGIIDTGQVNRESIRSILNVVPQVAKKTNLSVFEINLHPWDHMSIQDDSLTCSEDDRRFAHDPGRSEELLAVMDYESLLDQMNRLNIRPVGFDHIWKKTVE